MGARRRAGPVVAAVLVAALAMWISVRPARQAPPTPAPTHEPAARVASTPAPAGPVASSQPATALVVPAEAPRDVALQVQVRDTEGAVVPGARVLSADCGLLATADSQGRVQMAAPAARCSLRAARQDGLLFTRGPWTRVDLTAAHRGTVELVVDAARAGGLGVAVEPVVDGMQVTAVHPGTPAEAAGVSPGDVLVAVDGVAASELTIEQFLARMAGPEGTTMELEVSSAQDTGGGSRTVEVARVFLPEALLEEAAPDPH